MLRLTSPLVCILGSLSFLVPVSDGSEPIPKGEVPTIIITNHTGQEGQLCAPFCNLSIYGRISHQLGWPQKIDFRFYHVTEDGQLIYQGGGGVRTDDRGEFGVSFDAPRHGLEARQIADIRQGQQLSRHHRDE